MGLYRDQILPRVVDRACRIPQIDERRDRVTAGLHGTVLEVGFGSGLNLRHLPPETERLLAVEPSTTALRLAEDRIAASDVPVEVVGLDGQRLPLDDASVDTALCTFSLCTIPDVDAAVRELHRVLRPGGTLHVLEHGLSPVESVARWQHRLTPLQRRLAGGCHLDRRIDRILADGGFDTSGIVNDQLPGARLMGYLYVGVARRI